MKTCAGRCRTRIYLDDLLNNCDAMHGNEDYRSPIRCLFRKWIFADSVAAEDGVSVERILAFRLEHATTGRESSRQCNRISKCGSPL